MSYSLNNLCWKCENEDKCTDRQDIENTINNIIHQKSYEEGHMGAGSIILHCQYIETKRKEDKS